MRVHVKPRLLAIPSVFQLSDLMLVYRDLAVARESFTATIGKTRVAANRDNLSYSLRASGLIHYRRGFNSGIRKHQLTDEIIKSVAPTDYELHRYLLDMADKYVAHSCNEFEQALATISVAEREDGIFEFQGVGLYVSSIELLNEEQTSQSISLIDSLISGFVEPERVRLEQEITKHCAELSSEDLRMLPDGFAPQATQKGFGHGRIGAGIELESALQGECWHSD